MKKIPSKLALKIAKANFPSVETLESRNRDSLDFHSVSVRGISNALNSAYLEGYVAAKQEMVKMF